MINYFSCIPILHLATYGIICVGDVTELIFISIIPHVNSPYKTSIDERLIFYNITRCYSDGEYCLVFAIAAGDIIKYQGGHMMRNADARTVRSRQETFTSNDGHDACLGDF